MYGLRIGRCPWAFRIVSFYVKIVITSNFDISSKSLWTVYIQKLSIYVANNSISIIFIENFKELIWHLLLVSLTYQNFPQYHNIQIDSEVPIWFVGSFFLSSWVNLQRNDIQEFSKSTLTRFTRECTAEYLKKLTLITLVRSFIRKRHDRFMFAC